MAGLLPSRKFRVGQALLLRGPVDTFGRGTAVKVVRVLEVDEGPAYMVEPYRLDPDSSAHLVPSGVRLTLGAESLAESLPDFQMGPMIP